MSQGGMGSIDLLMLSAQAALAMRCRGDLEGGIAAGYKFLRKRRPKDGRDDEAVRVARLVSVAGERRADLLQFLWTLPKDQATLKKAEEQAPAEELAEPEPEAQRLWDKVINTRRKVKQREMLADGLGGFSVSLRECTGGFGGRWVGKGGVFRFKPEDLPEKVRGLIAYPLEVPVLFPIDVGKAPWSLWHICCAFAGQYVRIYNHPDRYGVWGHDMADLSITGLTYYPDHKLIFPGISS